MSAFAVPIFDLVGPVEGPNMAAISLFEGAYFRSLSYYHDVYYCFSVARTYFRLGSVCLVGQAVQVGSSSRC